MSWVGLAAITHDPHGGGVAAVSRLLGRVLGERWGNSCHVITLMDETAPGGALEASAGARIRFGASLATAQVLRQCRWILYSHLAVAQVQTYLPQTLRRPYGVFLHGIEVWRPLTRVQQRVVREAALLVANSDYTANRIRETHPWIGPIAVCPLALPPEAERQAPAQLGAAIGSVPTVMIVARMDAAERYKGHDQLLEAWPLVAAQIPNAQLVVVGGGDDAARLKTKAGTLGLEPCVTFTGFVPDSELPSLYDRASVFAMPSRNEGFGLAYLEAMAHGVPCIGSIHDAARDVIVDGKTGFLVSQDDATALADRIVTLLSDPARRQQLGEAGRRRLDHLFSYSRFRDRLLGLLATSFGEGLPESKPMAAGAEIRA